MRKARPRPPRISMRATFAFAMSFRIVNNPISAPRSSKCISDAMLQRPANALVMRAHGEVFAREALVEITADPEPPVGAVRVRTLALCSEHATASSHTGLKSSGSGQRFRQIAAL